MLHSPISQEVQLFASSKLRRQETHISLGDIYENGRLPP